jgi:23S rRNA (uracil1939-C5)-methyltransferase
MSEAVTIEKLVYGGDGLGRLPSGEVVFVPWSAPGDKLQVRTTSGKPIKGKIDAVLETSSERTEPRCSVFGLCGGCQWQHITPTAQREWKRKIVVESLARIGQLKDVPVAETLGSDETAWHYRNRVQWDVQNGRLGYHQAQSNEITSFEHCWIISEPMNRLADWLQDYFAQNPPEGLQRVEVFTNTEGAMLLSLEGEKNSQFKELAKALREAFPAIVGVVHAETRKVFSGESHLIETLSGMSYQVSAGSFFQTNRHAAEQMLSVMGQWLLPGNETLLDLYAGVGTFSIAFKERFARILAIESAPTAAADARVNFTLNGALHIALLEGDVRGTLRKMQEHFDTSIVDPPRAGCQPEVLSWLASNIQKQILYVSCNPTTLARDLKSLTDAGWRIEAVQPLDMFPQTYHVETLVNLVRQ